MADPGMLGPQLQEELHGEQKSGPNTRPLTISLREYGTDQRVALAPAEHEILNSRFANYLALSRDWDTGRI